MGNENYACTCIKNIGQGSVIVDFNNEADNILNKLNDLNQINETNKSNTAIIKNQMVNKLNEIERKKEKNKIYQPEISTEGGINGNFDSKNKKEDKKKKNQFSRQSSEKIYTDISNNNSQKKNNINKPKNFKTILIYGGNETGKTSFVLKVCNNKFDVFYIPSFSDEKTNKSLMLNQKKFELQFIVSNDTSNIQEADCYLIYYDLTSMASYNYAKNLIIEKIFKLNYPTFLIGNKCDLRNKINLNDLKQFCNDYKCEEFKISIKDYIGISSVLKKFGEIFDYNEND